jgi:hypothetical protein
LRLEHLYLIIDVLHSWLTMQLVDVYQELHLLNNYFGVCLVGMLVFSGLELYALHQGRNSLKFLDIKKANVSWYVYTHESRLVLLASGMQCKTLAGYQVSSHIHH